MHLSSPPPCLNEGVHDSRPERGCIVVLTSQRADAVDQRTLEPCVLATQLTARQMRVDGRHRRRVEGSVEILPECADGFLAIQRKDNRSGRYALFAICH